ncbi:NADH-quinone oxidoreductase subunit B [Clostridium sardiniense]|uniref:NADH-quinone oxidoreductase subunit B n=1 Tax=Clostridium sardiniense TaxID=29369 RepID=A0ABS7KZA9_CLOSR|nr:NADH-quinone oxidoreductase subunit B [Clostridium sardiniense]MBY0756148.1 NADH-quinone oxidoreductase subunit B [Clostridium sardiniense]MDQ0458909.1 membrane-bound hydrogenase subunit mbhJ [Clostridium sardiniense]
MEILKRGMEKSPWIYHINTGSCNGCDIELVALLGPRYDIERYGAKLAGTPRHADIIVVTGPITSQSKERMLRVISQVPEPKVIMSLGSCPMSCNVFKGSYSVEGPLDKWVDVDVSVGGCAPKPEAIIEGLKKAIDILIKKRSVT